ncbi:MAG: carboxypeptidase-like regulatory domain-containing protein, partial [Patescibacteria group bacterium]
MKKALILKLIASFIITFLFFKYNALSAHAITCNSAFIIVKNAVNNTPVSGARIIFTKTDGSEFSPPTATNNLGEFRGTFSVPQEFTSTVRATEDTHYNPGSSTLNLEGTGECTAIIALSPSSGLTCSFILVAVDNTLPGDPVPNVDITIVTSTGTISISTGTDGEATWGTRGSSATREVSPTIVIRPRPSSGYSQTTGTLTDIGVNQCGANVHLVSSTPPTPVTCPPSGVSGTVVDSDGNGIEHANVFVATTNFGRLSTNTASDGTWTIPFSNLEVTGITISAVGYQTVTLPGQCTGTVQLTSTGVPGPGPTPIPLPNAVVPENLMHNIQLLAIALGAIIAVIRIILGALQIAGGGDNPLALEAGRDMITSSILGLLVILFAVTLLRVIGSSVLGIIN